MSDTVKITKKDRFNSIKALCEAIGSMDGFDIEGIIAFCDKEVATMDARAEKSKERAAEKRALGDELQDAIYAVLTEEPMTREQILGLLDPALDAKAGKVSFRLNVLADNGKVVKGFANVPGADGKNHKLTVYSLA